MNHNEEILNQALQTYGIESQLDMLVEECSELIQAVLKLKRNKSSDKEKEIVAMMYEIGDVHIVMKQMELLYFDEIGLQNIIDFKEERLSKRLSDAK